MPGREEAEKKISKGRKDNANQKGRTGKVLYIPFLIEEIRR
ncbi:MAG: hypothetical protein WAV32_00650 [Halobacteriota archaeon]